MITFRPIRKIIAGRSAIDGAGVHLVRVFGFNDTQAFDPFLMLDAFDSTHPEDYTAGFPWHPHRGIETVTYLVQGDIEHGDSLGNQGSILDGDCQWMTAGSGIIHQEMPKACDRMLGVQLWLNLPAKDKMTTPLYGDIKSADVPIVEGNGSKVRVVAGEFGGKSGAFQGCFVKATYLDVELTAGSEWHLDNDAGETLFVYILLGSGFFNPVVREAIDAKHAVLFGDGNRFWVQAGASGIRFLLLSGQPLHEPIAWGGPVVMNTRDELELAFRELGEDTFIKK